MQEHDGLSSEQLELERALRSLSPASARLDPIAAAFEAGRKIRQRQVRAWATAFVVLFLAASSSLIWMRKPATNGSQDIDASNPAARAQTQHPFVQNGPRIATVSFEDNPHRPGASSQSAQTQLPIQERPIIYPPQLPPSLMILQRAVEKDGLEGMPQTYLPAAEQMNFKNEL